MGEPLCHLAPDERGCVLRYLRTLREALGGDLDHVRLFGSAARGDMWPRASPFRSDIDLLVVTRRPLTAAEVEALGDATYPLFLECGRQIGPQFRTRDQLDRPESDRARAFAEEVARDGVTLPLDGG